jgi:hypothetical protein
LGHGRFTSWEMMLLAAVAAGLPSATAPRIALPSKRHGEANKQGMARMPEHLGDDTTDRWSA